MGLSRLLQFVLPGEPKVLTTEALARHIKEAKAREQDRVALAREKHWLKIASASRDPLELFTSAVEVGDHKTVIELINQGLQLTKIDRETLLTFIAEACEQNLARIKPGALIRLILGCVLSPDQPIVELLRAPSPKAEKLELLIKQLQPSKQDLMRQQTTRDLKKSRSGDYETLTADFLYICVKRHPKNSKLVEVLLNAGADPVSSYSRERSLVKVNIMAKEGEPSPPRYANDTVTTQLSQILMQMQGSPVEQLITKHVKNKFDTYLTRYEKTYSDDEHAWLINAMNYLDELGVKITDADRDFVECL